MTYLDLVNHVLRRLREDTVSTVTETDYSTMVADLVNDAMIRVQEAHNWSQLMHEATVSTTASQSTVELADSNEHVQVWQVVNDTSNTVLRQADRGWMKKQQAFAATEAQPIYWASGTQAADGDLTLSLYPTPDAVYSLKVLMQRKQDRLSAGTDVLLVPDHPVIQLATAFALEERGDSGGQNNLTQFARADLALSDAIALDMQRDPSLSVWTVC